MIHSALLIKKVIIESLFGHAEYTLNFSDGSSSNGADINVIYGLNGAGKTTVLQLIYNILTPEAAGTKTWVAQTPFRRVKIYFSDNDYIDVEKLKGLTGSYKIACVFGGAAKKFSVIANSENAVRNDYTGQQVGFYRDYLRSLKLNLFFMSDRRKYKTNSVLFKRTEVSGSEEWVEFVDPAGRRRRMSAKSDDGAPLSVAEISNAISTSFQSQIIESGLFAQKNSNTVYLELINSMSNNDSRDQRYSSVNQLIEELEMLKASLADATHFGVMPHIDISQYTDALRNVSNENLANIALVVELFLNAQRARIDSAKILVERIRSFINELNRFYTGKTFNFDVRKGFYISSSRTGDAVDFEWLSSGERQLFTILASIFLAQNTPCIILIDEPELSLNVLWQREFASSLKRLSILSPVQYIFASHSLEILNNPSVNVVGLGNAS
jgi:energy-coupling factor transporter ATP-binding protein EcfA2